MAQKKRKLKIKATFSKKRIIAGAIVFALIIASMPFYAFFQNVLSTERRWKDNGAGLAVTFIDVGQNDAAFIRLPNGSNMLIISGGDVSKRAAGNFRSALSNRVKGNEKIINHVVFSHNFRMPGASVNHIFGNYKVENFYFGAAAIGFVNFALDSDAFVHMPVMNEVSIYNSDGLIVVLFAPAVLDVDDDNNSVIVYIKYKDRGFLFMGGAKEAQEKWLVENYGNQIENTTVLKLAQHGDNNASRMDFLNAVQPGFAIISTSGRNGFPHPAVINRLNLLDKKPRVLRTDRRGNISLFVSNRSVSKTASGVGVRTQKGTPGVNWFVLCSAAMVLGFIGIFAVRIGFEKNKKSP